MLIENIRMLFNFPLYLIFQPLMIQLLLSIANFLIYTAGIIALLKATAVIFAAIRTTATSLNAKWAERYGGGSWAVVTGCTQGIGKGFCFELAALGFKLVLISRSGQKLEKLSHELWESYPEACVIIIVADFSKFSLEMYDEIYHKIDNIDISILVNNVGVSSIKKFHCHPAQEIEELININIKAMTHLSSKIIPHMLERKQKSAIVNLSSFSIQCPFNGLAVYTASKAYNDLFSRCLSEDYLDKIDVVSSRPCMVSTAGTKQTQDSTACTARECARGALKALGKSKVTAGHWTHILQSEITNLFGETASRWLGNIKMAQIQANKKKQ